MQPETISLLHPGALIVLCAPHAAREEASSLAAGLALRGPLTVLDGGNRFQPYRVTRLLRERTPRVDEAAARLFVRRAFTCYQVLALLEATPALPQPYLVLDLLATFYDEHVRDQEARRLVGLCLRQLERLCQDAPVVITLAPPLTGERAFLCGLVCAHAARVLGLQPPAPAATQPALFGG